MQTLRKLFTLKPEPLLSKSWIPSSIKPNNFAIFSVDLACFQGYSRESVSYITTPMDEMFPFGLDEPSFGWYCEFDTSHLIKAFGEYFHCPLCLNLLRPPTFLNRFVLKTTGLIFFWQLFAFFKRSTNFQLVSLWVWFTPLRFFIFFCFGDKSVVLVSQVILFRFDDTSDNFSVRYTPWSVSVMLHKANMSSIYGKATTRQRGMEFAIVTSFSLTPLEGA